MAHILLNEGLPGILGPMAFKPSSAKALRALAETILRGPSSMTSAERELIASVVSQKNDCLFCSESHAAAARVHWGHDSDLVDDVLKNGTSVISDLRLRSLVRIAVAVQRSGKEVTSELVTEARRSGATDEDIHDTVLVAAAFCMFNRYVDGLATPQPPKGHPAYAPMGERLAREGYVEPANQ